MVNHPQPTLDGRGHGVVDQHNPHVAISGQGIEPTQHEQGGTSEGHRFMHPERRRSEHISTDNLVERHQNNQRENQAQLFSQPDNGAVKAGKADILVGFGQQITLARSALRPGRKVCSRHNQLRALGRPCPPSCWLRGIDFRAGPEIPDSRLPTDRLSRHWGIAQRISSTAPGQWCGTSGALPPTSYER